MIKTRNLLVAVLPVFLLLQLTLGSLCWMALREMHRHKVKSQILHSLPENRLIHISLSNEQLATAEFKDDGKEIAWQGRMYDIVSVKAENGKIVLRCFDDTDETLLVWRMNKMNEESSHNPWNIILNEFELISTDQCSNYQLPLRPHVFTRLIFAEPEFVLPAFVPNVPTPPPDFC
ncbi:MAG: hypothetical protein MUC87_06730 [Bacteroidia bacterium]|jgi:hypothetical protein|nr:hypothetical protein [Bacteroidia bacterium]